MGVECPPETSNQKISADLSGKDRQGKKGKWGKKKKKKKGKLKKSKKVKWKEENL